MKWKLVRSLILVVLTLSLVLSTACAGNARRDTAGEGQSRLPGTADSETGRQYAADRGDTDIIDSQLQQGVLPLLHVNGEDYVQVDQLLGSLNMNWIWEDNGELLKFGENDVAFEVRLDSMEAKKEDESIRLKSAPIQVAGISYLPLAVIGDLLGDQLSFGIEGKSLILHPAAEQLNLNVDQDAPMREGDALDFGNDVEDPYSNTSSFGRELTNFGDWITDEDGSTPASALKEINIPALISRARTYLGVRYQFGADPYPQSGRFDCSSYIQYLFGRYGISMPRTARAQAQLGTSVSRSNLRVGDLLYFYVPGRFKTNKTVGHVGIYIGNNNMIHSSPQPENGVQITSINRAYWKETFLYAKRVAR